MATNCRHTPTALPLTLALINTQVGRPRNSEKSSQLPHYADQAAESLGVTRRTVEKDLRRGKNIAPDVLAEIAGTDAATDVRVNAGFYAPLRAAISAHRRLRSLTDASVGSCRSMGPKNRTPSS